MKRTLPALLGALAVFLTLNSQLSTGFAQGTAFTYQGRLNDGASPASGFYDLRFTIYDALSGGALQGGPVDAGDVAVSNGLFTVTLDFTAAPFNGNPRWLEIGVRPGASSDNFTNLTPRQPITATPYAVRAGNAAVAASASSVAAGNITGTIGLGQLPAALVTNGASGVNITGTFSGSGAGMTNVPGAIPLQIASGTTVLAQPNQAYDATNAAVVTFVLPTNANVGDIVKVNGLGAGGWQVTNGAGQAIHGFTAGFVWTARPSAPSSQPYFSVASSADGTRLVAGAQGGPIYTSTDSGVTWIPRGISGSWNGLASSANGAKLVAVGTDKQIYTSTDGGTNWTARGTSRSWQGVASSADGTKLVAVANISEVYISTDSGTNWTARQISRLWRGVASSADGTKLVAVASGNEIYTSADSGTNWTPRPSSRNWKAVASSADGNKLVAVVLGGQIHTSSDSGVTWIPRASSRPWRAVASSADGTKLVAVDDGNGSGGSIYISMDSGVTWIQSAPIARWYCVASSADGTKFVAGTDDGSFTGRIFTSSTIPLTGGQGASVELQYAGNGVWQPLTLPDSIGAAPNTTVTRDASGSISAVSFVGGGSGLTGLNASQLASGTVPDERLSANVSLLGSSIDSPDITDGTIVNADISSSAAIAYSKLSLANSVVNADISPSAAIADSKLGMISAAGKVADSALSTNVALRSSGNTFTGNQNISGSLTIAGTLNMENNQAIWAKNTNGVSQVVLWPRYSDDVTYLDYGPAGFHIRNNGGVSSTMFMQPGGNVGIGTISPANKLHVAGGITCTALTQTSDRNAKENFAPVSPLDVLSKVAALPITTWSFKDMKDGRHMGPMAQDFYAAFGLGDGDTTITSVDPDGVALAAIQGLNQKLEQKLAQKENEITELKARLEKLESLVSRQSGR